MLHPGSNRTFEFMCVYSRHISSLQKKAMKIRYLCILFYECFQDPKQRLCASGIVMNIYDRDVLQYEIL